MPVIQNGGGGQSGTAQSLFSTPKQPGQEPEQAETEAQPEAQQQAQDDEAPESQG